MKKFGINGQWRNKLFLIVIHHFSLVKAAMEHVCNCTKTVLPALTSEWCYQIAFFMIVNYLNEKKRY
jgi:hypothetical protein